MRRGFLALMFLGSLFITLSSLVYFDTETLAPFVVEKLPVRFESLWLFSLQVHVTSAIVTFPLCLALLTRWFQRHRAWHRWIGRLTGVGILGGLVPSGVVLAFEAKGGTLVTIGFLLSAAIVSWGMTAGVLHARRRLLLRHSHAMRHVVAQMTVAVTSRALLIALDAVQMNPETAYVVALWVPVVGSALVVEGLSNGLSIFKPQIAPLHPRSQS